MFKFVLIVLLFSFSSFSGAQVINFNDLLMKKDLIMALPEDIKDYIRIGPINWTYEKNVDDFTDDEKHFAMVLSEDLKGFIQVVCLPERVFKVRVSTGAFIGESATGHIQYRVDKKMAVKSKMLTAETGLYFNDMGHEFIQDIMAGKKKVLVQLDRSIGRRISIENSLFMFIKPLNQYHIA